MSFDWHVYLSETGAETSPESLFEHVCRSLEPLLHKGQTVEAVSRHFADDTDASDLDWWPAEVSAISGYLIRFDWCSQNVALPSDAHSSIAPETQSGGFWFDIRGSNWHLLRPFGSSQSAEHNWVPPLHFGCTSKGVRLNANDPWVTGLKRRAVPTAFFQQRALYVYEAIRPGGYFECEHEHNPGYVWPAKVQLNVGGRLKLSWFGTNGRKPHEKGSSFTMFYLHRRIHPLGWGKYYGLTYSPPPGLFPDRTISNVDAFIRGARSAFAFVSEGEEEGITDPRKIRLGHPLYHSDPPLHEFKVGWKLEAVNPKKPFAIQPATISKVFNARYFLVELDDLTGHADSEAGSYNANASDRICFVSHAGASEIIPVNSSYLRGLNLVPPPGWPSRKPFTWTNYLVFLSNDSKSHTSENENGLLRTPVNTTSPFIHNVQPHLSKSSSSELVYTLQPDVIHDQPSTAPTRSLFCPSEATFKGVQISELFPANGDLKTHDPALHSENTLTTTHNRTNAEDNSDRSAQRSVSSRFLLGMKLEMAIPDIFLSDNHTFWCDIGPKLCTATVTRVEGPHMLWLLPDLPESLCNGTIYPIIVDSRSTDLYPVGWAASFGHPIIAPPGYEECTVDTQSGLPTQSSHPASWNIPVRPTHDLQIQMITYEAEELCPPVYISTRCYIGPFLCRASLELLPRCFGPGPTSRVMHSLLTRLVSASYRPVRVLRMFEADWVSGVASALAGLRSAHRNSVTLREGIALTRARSNLRSARENLTQAESEVIEQRRSGMRVVVLRVRCPRRGVKIEAPVEVCCRARAVEEFCRQVSLVLEACPHLISTRPTVQEYPENATNFIPSDNNAQAEDSGITNRKCECPSFCCSRLRSRNMERQPGWKRKMVASIQPFGLELGGRNDASLPVSRSTTVSTSTLRTRSAVAAAQRQQHGLNRQLQSFHYSAASNGLPVGRTARRSGGSSKRFRGPPGRQTMDQPAESQSLTVHIGSPYISDRADSVSQNFRNVSKLMQPGQHNDYSLRIKNLHLPRPLNHNLWLNYRHPYLDSSMYASRRYRPVHRLITTHDRYLQDPSPGSTLADVPRVILPSNPLFWSSVDLASYLGGTDCREMWPWLAAEAVDGQAFMLLTLPVLHHLVGLQWEDAVRLARHVASVKRAFVEQFNGVSNDDRANCPQTS